ncbi:head GIN domain-containing protein [Namhaeicola litoreus]|uniref:Head GIN domain-containing protein n=1 Tax=Namhaeicola litoreus TaxID=1052145 RepID=A0ABW3Y7W7_9FLAO
MKKSILFIAAILIFSNAIAQNWNKVKGNGNVIKVNRSVGPFEAVEVSGSFDVFLVEGKEGEMTIEGDENLMEYLETDVNNGDLKIKWKKGYNISTRNSFVIHLSVEEINHLSLSGSGKIESKVTLRGDDFSTSVSGSGDMDIVLETNELKVAVSGSGNMDLQGTANQFEASVSGSGDIDAKNLKCKIANMKISGSGGVNLDVSDELIARVSGSGDIRYKGNPAKQDVKVSGSGDITKM